MYILMYMNSKFEFFNAKQNYYIEVNVDMLVYVHNTTNITNTKLMSVL